MCVSLKEGRFLGKKRLQTALSVCTHSSTRIGLGRKSWIHIAIKRKARILSAWGRGGECPLSGPGSQLRKGGETEKQGKDNRRDEKKKTTKEKLRKRQGYKATPLRLYTGLGSRLVGIRDKYLVPLYVFPDTAQKKNPPHLGGAPRTVLEGLQ